MKTKKEIEKEVFGDVFTLKEFIYLVNCRAITYYDGIGYFYDGEKEMREIDIFSCDEIPNNVDYVIWYNN